MIKQMPTAEQTAPIIILMAILLIIIEWIAKSLKHEKNFKDLTQKSKKGINSIFINSQVK
jgi:hypothetical protein